MKAEQQALVVAPAQEVAPVTTEQNLFAVIAKAAMDGSVDVAKMEALLAMQERIQAKSAEVAFNQSMAQMQPRLPRVQKRGAITISKGSGPMSKYALFEDIDKAVRPLLAEFGFALNYGMGIPVENRVVVTCTIRHVAGHSITNALPLPLDASGAKNNVQGVGSTISYARRYLMCLMLNIVLEGEDNDGNNSEPINDQQLMQIEDMLQASGGDRAKFCKTFKVEKISELRQDQLQGVMTALRQKLAGKVNAGNS